MTFRHLAPLAPLALVAALAACREPQADNRANSVPFGESHTVPTDHCTTPAKTVTVTLKADFFKDLASPSLCNLGTIRVDENHPDATRANPAGSDVLGSRASCLAGIRPAVAHGDPTRPDTYTTPLDLDVASLFPHNTTTMTAQIDFVLDTSMQNAFFLPSAADANDAINAVRIDAEPDPANPIIFCRRNLATTPTSQIFGFQVAVPPDIGIKTVRRYSLYVVLGTKQSGFYVPIVIDPKIPDNGTHTH